MGNRITIACSVLLIVAIAVMGTAAGGARQLTAVELRSTLGGCCDGVNTMTDCNQIDECKRCQQPAVPNPPTNPTCPAEGKDYIEEDRYLCYGDDTAKRCVYGGTLDCYNVATCKSKGGVQDDMLCVGGVTCTFIKGSSEGYKCQECEQDQVKPNTVSKKADEECVPK